MELTQLVAFKLIAPFAKLIFAIGGWFASLLIQVVSPEEIGRKELTYRLVTSIVSVPAVMAIDVQFNLNKWLISVLTVALGLFMWLIIDIAKKKAPKKIKDYIDKNL